MSTAETKRRMGKDCMPRAYSLDHLLRIGVPEECGICGATTCPSGRALAIDHDHSTGRLRGFLCFSCNTGIGKFKDSTALLSMAMDYLSTPPAERAASAHRDGRKP